MQKINAQTLKHMFLGGANNLINNKDYVDKLNVFPVPDGDTGTNMSLTLKSAIEEVEKSNYKDLKTLRDAITKDSLMSARSNSGIIRPLLTRNHSRR